MTRPVRHHFVPQFIIRNFADASGWLYGYDASQPQRGVFRSRPDNIFVERHLYSFRNDGESDPSGELALSVLEDRVAPVVAKIVAAARARTLPRLTPQERYVWDRFFIAQWKRVPDVRREVVPDARIREIFESTAASIAASHPHFRGELDRLREPHKLAELIQNARVGSLLTEGGAAAAVLAKRGLMFLHVGDHRRGFVLGSRPVVKLGISGATDMRDPRSEMWFPVSPDVAVGPGNDVEAEAGRVLDDHRLVRTLNNATWSQSSAVAGRARKQIQSLVDAR